MTNSTTNLNMADIPAVSARELSVAVKVLMLHGGSLANAHSMSDAALQGAFGAYWDLVSRDTARKTATLVRLQHLILACQSRRLRSFLSTHGKVGMMALATAAAAQRLNVEFGMNPVRLDWAASAELTARQVTAVAA